MEAWPGCLGACLILNGEAKKRACASGDRAVGLFLYKALPHLSLLVGQAKRGRSRAVNPEWLPLVKALARERGGWGQEEPFLPLTGEKVSANVISELVLSVWGAKSNLCTNPPSNPSGTYVIAMCLSFPIMPPSSFFFSQLHPRPPHKVLGLVPCAAEDAPALSTESADVGSGSLLFFPATPASQPTLGTESPESRRKSDGPHNQGGVIYQRPPIIIYQRTSVFQITGSQPAHTQPVVAVSPSFLCVVLDCLSPLSCLTAPHK